MEVTAVEWFYDKIKSHFEHDGDLLEGLTFTYAIAKQKENQQIIDAFTKSRLNKSECKVWNCEGNERQYQSFEDYYNDTYGKQD